MQALLQKALQSLKIIIAKDLNTKLAATYNAIKNIKDQIKEKKAQKENLEKEYSKIINTEYL